jgi:SAM-dependent methyltransferase
MNPTADPARPPCPHPLRRRLCACILRHCMGPHERALEPHRRALLRGLAGNVVEIGPGTGVNIPFLAAGAAGPIIYTAIEPNTLLHADIRAAAEAAGFTAHILPTSIGPGRLDLPDASADAVVCTLVLCSVPDPDAALAEIARLLRPGGRLIIIEHVAAPRRTALRAIQRIVRPVWRVPGDGCDPARDTEATLRRAPNLRIESLTRFRAPIPVVSPHIAGVLVRV